MKKTIVLAALAAVTLSFCASCQKEAPLASEKCISFTATTTPALLTKAAYSGVRTETSERIDWENGDLVCIFTETSDPQSADYKVSGTITPDGTLSTATLSAYGEQLKWWGDEDSEKVFYGVYPSPSFKMGDEFADGRMKGTVSGFQKPKSVSNAAPYLAVADLKDEYMLSKKSTKYSENITLEFTPMTTAIEFTIKNSMEPVLKISQISLISETHDISGAFTASLSDWTGKYPTCSASGTGDKTVIADFSGTVIETTGLAKNETLTFTVFLRPTEDIDDLTFKITKPDGGWISTKLATGPANYIVFPQYKKSYVTGLLIPGGVQWTNWTLTVTPWDEVVSGDIIVTEADFIFEASKDSHTFRNTTSQETVTIDVTSEMSISGETIGNVGWNIKSYQVGTSDPVSVGDSSFSGVVGISATAGEGSLSLTAAARTSANPGLNDYWTNKGGISGDSDGTSWSPKSWEEKGVIDLSKYNPYTDTQDAHNMTTANCYIIRHAGTYKLPLVYGNAMVDGNTNVESFYPGITGDKTLERFVNAYNHGIESPFIENDASNAGEYLNCAIIWQDQAQVVTNIRLSADAVDVSHVYTKDDVRYLVFDVPQNLICQSNALICVFKDKVGGTTDQYDPGEAIWSWHIWTTNDPALLSDPIPVTNLTNVEYDFFPLYNIGWIDSDCYPSRPDVKIVLQQEISGKEIEISVSQLSIAGAKSSGCYYQFGRKDPMPSTVLNPDGFSVAQGPASLSSSIQNPGAFYKKSNNWCSEIYNNLWTGKKSATGPLEQDGDMIKTIYDPSPVGYKLPASRAFTGFTDTGVLVGTAPTNCNVYGSFNNGWNFYTKPGKNGETMYFPAVGYRKNTDGSVVAGFGDYWAAVPYDGNNGCYLYSIKTHIDPLRYFDRAYGIMVRPVLEK